MSDSSQDTVTFEETKDISKRDRTIEQEEESTDSEEDDDLEGLTLGVGGSERYFRKSSLRVFEEDSEDAYSENKISGEGESSSKSTSSTTRPENSAINLISDEEDAVDGEGVNEGRNPSKKRFREKTKILSETVSISSDEEEGDDDDIEVSEDVREMKENLRKIREGRNAVKAEIRREDREFQREQLLKKRRLEEEEKQKRMREEEEKSQMAAKRAAAKMTPRIQMIKLKVIFGPKEEKEFEIPAAAPLRGLIDEIKEYKSCSKVKLFDPDNEVISPEKLPKDYELEDDDMLTARTA